MTDSYGALCIPAVSCAVTQIPNLDGCCINTPGGLFLSTQFWDPSPAIGGNETWTLHGLWPDHCTAGFDQYCDNTRSLSTTTLTDILDNASAPLTGTHPGLRAFMDERWLSNDAHNANLWAHEWNKHGTCISTLEHSCYTRDHARDPDQPTVPHSDVLDYFTHAALLYSTLPTFEFFARHGIEPSHERTYELAHLQQAIRDSSHGADAVIHCRNHDE